MIHFKSVSSIDYPLLISIWEGSVLATHDFLAENDFLFYKSQLKSYFENLDLYILESDNIAKGFIGVSEQKLEMLFIDKSSIGEGFGKKLLNFAIHELGINEVDVNQQNIQAVGFYKHHGFVESGFSELDGEGKNYPIVSLSLKR